MADFIELNTQVISSNVDLLAKRKDYYFNKSSFFYSGAFSSESSPKLSKFLNKINNNYKKISINIENIREYLEDYYKDVEGIENKFIGNGGSILDDNTNSIVNKYKDIIIDYSILDELLFVISSVKNNNFIVSSVVNVTSKFIGSALENLLGYFSLSPNFNKTKIPTSIINNGEVIEVLDLNSDSIDGSNDKSILFKTNAFVTNVIGTMTTSFGSTKQMIEKIKELETVFSLDYNDEYERKYINTMISLMNNNNVPNENAIKLLNNIGALKKIDPNFEFNVSDFAGVYGIKDETALALSMDYTSLSNLNVSKTVFGHEVAHAYLGVLQHAPDHRNDYSYAFDINVRYEKIVSAMKTARENLKNNPEILYEALRYVDEEWNSALVEAEQEVSAGSLKSAEIEEFFEIQRDEYLGGMGQVKAMLEETGLSQDEIEKIIDKKDTVISVLADYHFNTYGDMSKEKYAKGITQILDKCYEYENSSEYISLKEKLEYNGVSEDEIDDIIYDKNSIQSILLDNENLDDKVWEKHIEYTQDFSKYGSTFCVSDIISSITQSNENVELENGDILFYTYSHDNEYMSSDLNAYNELFANFFDLTVNGQTEALEKIKPILGDELYEQLNLQIDDLARIYCD